MRADNSVISIKNMTMTAVFAAVLCVTAPFSIPVGPIPLSLATFVIYLASATLGWKYGTLSVAIYILIGAVGVPVFSGFQGGFHRIVGVTGGYIIGYIPLAIATGIAADRLAALSPNSAIKKNKISQAAILAAGMIVGTLLLYTIGTAWFMFQTNNTLTASLALCVIPFLPGDAIKIFGACLIAPKMRVRG